MSDVLDALAALAVGGAATARPRPQLRFEVVEEEVATEREVSAPAVRVEAPTPLAPAPVSERVVTTHERETLVERHTEAPVVRVEAGESRVVEKRVVVERTAPVVERTVVERVDHESHEVRASSSTSSELVREHASVEHVEHLTERVVERTPGTHTVTQVVTTPGERVVERIVAAAPRPQPALPVPAPPGPPAPSVQVSIGRVEIRAPEPAPPPRRPRPAAPPRPVASPDLSEYLASLDGRR